MRSVGLPRASLLSSARWNILTSTSEWWDNWGGIFSFIECQERNEERIIVLQYYYFATPTETTNPSSDHQQKLKQHREVEREAYSGRIPLRSSGATVSTDKAWSQAEEMSWFEATGTPSPPNMPHTSVSVRVTFRLSNISISHSAVSDILRPHFATVCWPAVRQNTCRLFGVINSGFLYATSLLSLKKKVPFCTIICLPQISHSVQFSSVQSLSRVRLFATPWIAAHQASLSITNSRSSLKPMSIESVMPPSHLILSSPSPLAPSPSQHQGHVSNVHIASPALFC